MAKPQFVQITEDRRFMIQLRKSRPFTVYFEAGDLFEYDKIYNVYRSVKAMGPKGDYHHTISEKSVRTLSIFEPYEKQ